MNPLHGNKTKQQLIRVIIKDKVMSDILVETEVIIELHKDMSPPHTINLRQPLLNGKQHHILNHKLHLNNGKQQHTINHKLMLQQLLQLMINILLIKQLFQCIWFLKQEPKLQPEIMETPTPILMTIQPENTD